MQRKKPGVDVVRDALLETLVWYPKSDFVKSLLNQYDERGGLSKKQLQGLLGKIEKIENFPSNWKATIEAEILKKPLKTRSALPENKPLFEKDTATESLINSILAKFPQHKRALFLQQKFNHNEILTAVEMNELKTFSKLLK